MNHPSHKIALLPGSFDPPSKGHLDVIQRGAKLCDKLYVAVARNTSKANSLLSLNEKMELLGVLTHSLPQVKIVALDGLVVDFAKIHHVNFLLRGLRSPSDLEYESRMALANKKIGGIETLFLMADPQFAHISGTLIREIAIFGGSLNEFIPPEIEPAVLEKLQRSLNLTKPHN
jgi:pantetheine-phosphate adenylyltransferase